MAKVFIYLIVSTVLYQEATTSTRFRMVNGDQVGQLVNHEVVNDGKYLFVVHISIHHNDTYFGICTGSIIKTNVVLTAAHCIFGADPQVIKVHAGLVYKGQFHKGIQEQVARETIVHDEYNVLTKPKTNDIALIFLETPFQISQFVDKIGLPGVNDYVIGSNLTAIGWGKNEKGDIVEWLQKVEFILIKNEVCQSYADAVNMQITSGPKNNITENMMCAIDYTYKGTTCHGDSGGPIMNKDKLVGVIAAGLRLMPTRTLGRYTCDQYYPAVFMKLIDYVDWIKEKIY